VPSNPEPGLFLVDTRPYQRLEQSVTYQLESGLAPACRLRPFKTGQEEAEKDGDERGRSGRPRSRLGGRQP
jgi:hypothetical protein